jgi:chromosome segregation and condensation protein ScpB
VSERLYLELKGKLEALLFAAVRPLSVKTLARLLQLEVEAAEKLIHELG